MRYTNREINDHFDGAELIGDVVNVVSHMTEWAASIVENTDSSLRLMTLGELEEYVNHGIENCQSEPLMGDALEALFEEYVEQSTS